MERLERTSELVSAGPDRSLAKAALYAALLAAAGNSIVYVICYLTGIIPWNMLSPGRGVSLTPRLVILVSVGGAIAGALMYALIRRIASNPVRTFRIVAGVVLLLSFTAPFAIPTFTTALMVALDVMHIVVYLATVWALTVWTHPWRVRATA
jgi:hypothetical protein